MKSASTIQMLNVPTVDVYASGMMPVIECAGARHVMRLGASMFLAIRMSPSMSLGRRKVSPNAKSKTNHPIRRGMKSASTIQMLNVPTADAYASGMMPVIECAGARHAIRLGASMFLAIHLSPSMSLGMHLASIIPTRNVLSAVARPSLIVLAIEFAGALHVI
jgi:hypothetical protein